MTGAYQLLKSPHQFEGEGDKISHKNADSVISYFLGRMVLSNGSKPWMNLHTPLVCVFVQVCVCTGVWAKRKGDLREAKNKVRKLAFAEIKCHALSQIKYFIK